LGRFARGSGAAGRLSAKGAGNIILKEMRDIGLKKMADGGAIVALALRGRLSAFR
jgi:hypothetical protein